MHTELFEEVFDEQVAACRSTLIEKAKEYATEDRLHNFKVAAKLQNTTERDALCGMMAKHIVSVFDLARADNFASMDVWDEKIGDAINYLFLLKAVVIEEYYNTAIIEPIMVSPEEYNIINNNNQIIRKVKNA
jgi:hypothetical protein